MHCVGLLFEEIRKNLHMSILVLVDYNSLRSAKVFVKKNR